MKTANYFKQFLPAVAALTLVGTVSSCRDNDFDWDDAHANSQQLQFDKVFFKEYGKPAEGHQWGFDFASLAMGGTINLMSGTRSEDPASDGYVYKQQMRINDIPAIVLFGTPADITPREHLEVYAWFLMHKVNWTNTPVNFNIETRESTKQSDGWAYKRTDMTYEQALAHVNLMAKAEGIKNSDGTDFQLDRLSFLDSQYGNVTGNYKMGTDITFRNAWIQTVANDNLTDYDDDEVNYSDQSVVSSQMDFLRCWALTSDGAGKWGMHLYDNNGGVGYGWYRQPSNDRGGKYPINGAKESSGQNASLVINCDVNNWTYGCSLGSSTPHDKFYIVHLQGEGYEGWYLGMDLESYGDANSSKCRANGVCNDWIIKIGDGGSTSYTHSRIMCEDLGGAQITASDIDYNDLVMDVDYVGQGNANAGEGKVMLSVRAAGGTMPLAVFYDNVPLFEVHEFLKLGKVWTDNGHVQTSEDFYKVMYNTSWTETNTGEEHPRLYALGFNMDVDYNYEYSSGNWIKAPSKRFSGGFDLQKLDIKVFRPFEQGSVAEYVEYGGSNSSIPTTEAYWVTLSNIDGSAPLKICVPQEYNGNPIKWLKERKKISDTYQNFRDWVGNPTKIFWGSVDNWNPTITNTGNLQTDKYESFKVVNFN